MNKVGISLGWNCNSAIYGVKNGIRLEKKQGYKTCPFDEMVSNYPGVIKCIDDDFKYFCDSKYLKLIQVPQGINHFEHLKNKEGVYDTLIQNTYYNFIFNHESPGHADLYISQNWSGGITHYIDNDFLEFKKRYKNRIDNFKNYLTDSNNIIVFIIHRYKTNETNIHELIDVLNRKYPSLNYEFYFLDVEYNKDIIKEHLLLCGLDNNCDEVTRLEE